MSTDAVTIFLALLALGSLAITLALAVVAVCGALSDRVAPFRGAVMAGVADHANELSLLAASIATAGSLYMSEVAGFLPCRLCWFQRTMMYPLVPLFALIVLRRDRGGGLYGLALAAIGLGVSLYHILVERFPQLESAACEATNPCSLKWVEWFGFVTIPVMAASAFAFVIAVQAIRMWVDIRGADSTDDSDLSDGVLQ